MRKRSLEANSIFTNNQGCKAKVITYNHNTDVLIEFIDKHRHQMRVRKSHLLSGKIRNPYYPSFLGVGYLGDGDYSKSHEGVNTAEFIAWKHMLARCYCQNSHKKSPTYIGCTVAHEWHNFQNFAKWYTSQIGYGKNYHLDKDLLISGNKVYSPSTCALSPPEINTLLNDNKARRGDYPVGVSLDRNSGRFSSKLKKYGKKVHLGHFCSAMEAAEVYRKAKKEHIRDVAFKWKDEIDERLFNALMQRSSLD